MSFKRFEAHHDHDLPEGPPPPYLWYDNETLAPSPNKATIYVGFPTREIDWLRHVADGRAQNFCSTCNSAHSPKPDAWCSLDDLMVRHYKRPEHEGHDKFYNLDSTTTLHWPNLAAATNVGQWCPRRFNMHMQKGTTFTPPETIRNNTSNRDSIPPFFYHHSIDAKVLDGRILLKIQRYRELSDTTRLSIEELRRCLPTCKHLNYGPIALAKQFQDARERFLDRKERVATLIFACRECTSEYITMIVPRAPCHLPDSSRFPSGRRYKQIDKDFSGNNSSSASDYAPFEVDYRSDWVIVFCRWMEMGPCYPSKPLECHPKRQDKPSVGMIPRGPGPHQRLQTIGGITSCQHAVSSRFDGQDIWPYSHARPKLVYLAPDSPDLEELLRDAPSVFSKGWEARPASLIN